MSQQKTPKKGVQTKMILLVLLVVVLAGAIVTYVVSPDLMQGFMRGRSQTPTQSQGKGGSSVNCQDLPDLKIISIKYHDFGLDNYSVSPGEEDGHGQNNYELDIIVKNFGGNMQTPSNISFGLKEDYSPSAEYSIVRSTPGKKALKCGRTMKYRFKFRDWKKEPYSGGLFVVDATEQVQESDEENNETWYLFRNRSSVKLIDSNKLQVRAPIFGNPNIDPLVDYMVFIYTKTINASDLYQYGFNGNSGYINNSQLKYYSSNLYADDIAGLPGYETWQHVDSMSIEYYTSPIYSLQIGNFAPYESGRFLVIKEKNKDTGATVNFSQLIYIPPAASKTRSRRTGR